MVDANNPQQKGVYKFFYITFGKSKHKIVFCKKYCSAPKATKEARQLRKLFDVKAIASYGWELLETELRPNYNEKRN